MKQAKLIVAIVLFVTAAAVISLKLGLFDGGPGIGRDLSPEEIRRAYEEEIEAYRERRAVAEREAANDPRDPFARQITETGSDFGEWLARELAETEPVCTQEDLDRWTEELSPMIEEITGLEFAEPPVVKLADRKMLIASLEQDLNVFMHAGESNALGYARTAATLQSAMLLGNFGMHTREVYVMGGNFEPLLRDAELSEAELRDVAKLVLAHELVHALQDQTVPHLDQMRTGLDAQPAVHAAIEGHATLVEQIIAEELGLKELSETLFGYMTGEGGVEFEGEWAAAAEGFREWIAFTYAAGRDFMRHHLDDGGHAKLRKVLLSPPQQVSSILSPSLWDDEPRRLPRDLVPLSVRGFIEGRGFLRSREPGVPQSLYEEVHSRLNAQARALMTDQYDGAMVDVFKPEGEGGVVVLLVHRFRNPDDPGKWAEEATWFAYNLKQYRETDGGAMEAFADTPLEGLEEIGGRRICYTDLIEGRGRLMIDESYAVIDRVCVQVFISAIEVDDEFHRRIHEDIWRHYQETVLGEGAVIDDVAP